MNISDAPERAVSRLLILVVTLFSLNLQAQESHYQLEKVVEVSRHGVRPPTPGDRKLIEAGSGRNWPAWQTEDGHLTDHGEAAVILKARYEVQRYRELGLLTAGCPSAGEVYIRSSPLQRTQATAKAYSAAAFPGCHVSVETLKNKDLLFTFPSNKASEAEKARNRQEALTALGGDLHRAQQRLQPQISALKKAVCEKDHPCPAFEQPWVLKTWSNGGLAIEGLDTLAAMAETIRLAWSENQPLDKVAFGHASSAADVGKLMPLLTAKYDYTNDLPSAARRGGSVLMGQIAKALRLGEQQDAPPDVRWLLYVASDINISYLRTLLHFTWLQGDYPRGNIPPGGSLVFERWRDNQGHLFIRVYFQSQSPDQIRQLTPLSDDNALLITEWHFSGCRATEVGTLCPYESAAERIERNIDHSRLVPVSYP